MHWLERLTRRLLAGAGNPRLPSEKKVTPMSMNYADYPKNWKEIRTAILERAGNAEGIPQCECMGECGRGHDGTRCPHIQYGRLTTRSKYKVILTTAHLCHDTKCARADHLKSMCQPCHQVFDLRERQKRKQEKKDSKFKVSGDLLEFFQKVGAKGGTARASRYSHAQLSRWARLGGRPPKHKHLEPATIVHVQTAETGLLTRPQKPPRLYKDSVPVFKQSEVFPIIAAIIENLYVQSGDYVTHDNSVNALLEHREARPLLGSCPTDGSRTLTWWAHNMVAWFSKVFTDRRSDWNTRFERKKIHGKWAYRVRKGLATTTA
jgi:hypothetical protein